MMLSIRILMFCTFCSTEKQANKKMMTASSEMSTANGLTFMLGLNERSRKTVVVLTGFK